MLVLVLAMLFALAMLTNVEVAARTCKVLAEGGLELGESLLSQATSISGAWPRIVSVFWVVLKSNTTSVTLVTGPWQLVAPILEVMLLHAQFSHHLPSARTTR